jgi:hypothetical protein
VTIAASSEVRNASGLAADLAVETADGATTIDGRMIGPLAFGGTSGNA